MLENVKSWININYSPYHRGIGEINDRLYAHLHYINCGCKMFSIMKKD